MSRLQQGKLSLDKAKRKSSNLPVPSSAAKSGKLRKSTVMTPAGSSSNLRQPTSIRKRSSSSSSMGRPSTSHLGSAHRNPHLSRTSYAGVDQLTMKDTRPLTDKFYKEQSIFQLIEMLNVLGYPHNLTPKLLNPPQNKEYQRIFETLMANILLSKYQIIGNPGEAMHKAAKDLGYPFNLSKSTLNNVGTMSAWPQALGLLMWMVSLVQYSVGCDAQLDVVLKKSERSSLKREFMYETYQEFMKGNDGPYDNVLAEFQPRIDKINVEKSKELEAVSKRIGQLKEQLEDKIKLKEEKEGYEEIEALKRADIQKLKDYYADLDSYVERKKQGIDKFNKDAEDYRNQLEAQKTKIIQLKSSINHQDLSSADVEKMNLEKKQMEDAILCANQRAEDLEKRKWDLEILFGKSVRKSDELMKQVNSSLKKLVEGVGGIGFVEEECQLLTGNAGLRENKDRLTSKIIPFITAVTRENVKTKGEQCRTFNDLNKRLAQDEETLADANTELGRLRELSDKYGADMEQQKEEAGKVEQKLKTEIINSRTKIEQLKIVISQSEVGTTLHEIQQMRRDALKQYEVERNCYVDGLSDVIKQLHKYRDDTQALYESACDRIDAAQKASKARISRRLELAVHEVDVITDDAGRVVTSATSDVETADEILRKLRDDDDKTS